MSTLSIIILAGEAGSGKSETLHAMIGSHCTKEAPHIYFAGEKKIYVSLSSPQEYPGYRFCDVSWVTNKVRAWIGECKGKGCALLIAPFQISISQRTNKINADCIEKPVAELKKNFKVHVVYLRKNGSRNRPITLVRLSRIDSLMQGLKNDEIESRKGQAKRQADELWNILMRIDP